MREKKSQFEFEKNEDFIFMKLLSAGNVTIMNTVGPTWVISTHQILFPPEV